MKHYDGEPAKTLRKSYMHDQCLEREFHEAHSVVNPKKNTNDHIVIDKTILSTKICKHIIHYRYYL
jgi:hypothetical protein